MDAAESPHTRTTVLQALPPARLAGLGLVLAVVAYRYYQDWRWRLHRSLSWWAPAPRRRRR